ncbi:type II toxin-antitoxin system ribonuclease VapC29 [soil metagenome]
MTDLLDANVLVALASPDHVHHGHAHAWFAASGQFATTPLTQLALVRLLMRFGTPVAQAVAALDIVRAHDRHTFWSDDVWVDVASMAAVIGHRQVTDAHLVALARRYEGRLATFDRGLVAVHQTATVLVPTAT